MANQDNAPKSYRISNQELGPRGIETKADGLVMVHPTAPGSPGTTVARLTDEEAERAGVNGLVLEELPDGLLAEATGDRPAAGFINPDHPDASKIAKAVHDNARRAAEQSTKTRPDSTSNLDRPIGGKSATGSGDGKTAADESKHLSKMNRAELDKIVADEKIDIGDASTNATIADKIAAHRKAKADATKTD